MEAPEPWAGLGAGRGAPSPSSCIPTGQELVREHRGWRTGSGCGRWHAGLCAPAPGGCEGCEPPSPAGAPPLAGFWQGARWGCPAAHHLPDSTHQPLSNTAARLDFIPTNLGLRTQGSCGSFPLPSKPCHCAGGSGGIPAPPAPSPGWGSPKSWLPSAPTHRHPRPSPRTPARGGEGRSRLIPGDPRRPHPVTLPVPLPARFGSRALVLHYFKLV